MEYLEVDRARMEPDIYDGPNCDEIKPRWIVGFPKEGDTDMGKVLEFDAEHFPPGARVIVESPVCPKCGEIYENCNLEPGLETSRTCDFDWGKWVEEQYS